MMRTWLITGAVLLGATTLTTLVVQLLTIGVVDIPASRVAAIVAVAAAQSVAVRWLVARGEAR